MSPTPPHTFATPLSFVLPPAPAHGLSKRPVLRFLLHRLLILSHSAVLASGRYFRPTALVGIHKLIDCSRSRVSLSSLECGHHVIYGLGWPGLFKRIHQFGRLEQQHGKCGPGLV